MTEPKAPMTEPKAPTGDPNSTWEVLRGYGAVFNRRLNAMRATLAAIPLPPSKVATEAALREAFLAGAEVGQLAGDRVGLNAGLRGSGGQPQKLIN